MAEEEEDDGAGVETTSTEDALEALAALADAQGASLLTVVVRSRDAGGSVEDPSLSLSSSAVRAAASAEFFAAAARFVAAETAADAGAPPRQPRAHAFALRLGPHGAERKRNTAALLLRAAAAAAAAAPFDAAAAAGGDEYDDDDDDAPVPALDALRILLREPSGLEDFAADADTVRTVLRLALAVFPARPRLCEASLRVTINLLANFPAARAWIVADGRLADFVAEKFAAVTFPSALVFPFARLATLLAKDAALRPRLARTLTPVARLLEQCVDAGDLVLAGEMLSAFFVLTIDLGPLASSPPASTTTSCGEEKEDADASAAAEASFMGVAAGACVRLLATVDVVDPAHADLVSSAVSALLNVPAGLVAALDTFEVCALRLLPVLRAALGGANTEASAVPLLMLLARAAGARAGLADALARAVFPAGAAPATVTPPDETESLASAVIPHLTSTSLALKHFAGEFLFALSRKNAELFVGHVGLGPAAGFLADHGLLGALGTVRDGKGESTAVEDSSAAAAAAAAPAAASRDGNKDDDDDEEEEKDGELDEEEMAEAMRKLARLEELGIFKITRRK